MGELNGRDSATHPRTGDDGPGSDFFVWRTFDPAMLPGGAEFPFAAELVAYRDRLDEMLPGHAGGFVVIEGGRIAGYHRSRTAALKAAHREFGREPATIKQVVE